MAAGQAGDTFARASALIDQLRSMDTAKDLDRVVEDSGKLVAELRNLTAWLTLISANAYSQGINLSLGGVKDDGTKTTGG
jgi:hypothetical protein